jgi:hypothetical protein
MTDLPPGPPFQHRLPSAVAGRIRATAGRRRRRRTAVVPVICIFGRGAFLDGDTWRDGDGPAR